MDTASSATAPATSPVAGNGSHAGKRQSNIEFPIRLSLNITPAMANSLARISRRMRLKEGIVGRLGLMAYLQANDAEYREQ